MAGNSGPSWRSNGARSRRPLVSRYFRSQTYENVSYRIRNGRDEDERHVGQVGGSMSRNFEVAVVELKQPLLEGGVIDVCDLLADN